MEDRIEGLRSDSQPLPIKLQKFLELADSACSSYKQGLLEEKREYLETLTSNREMDGGNLIIKLNLPFDLVANRPQVSSGAPQRFKPRSLDAIRSLRF